MDLNSLSLSERNYIITQDNRRYLRELYKQYERKKNKNKIGEYLKTPKFEEVIYEDTFKEQLKAIIKKIKEGEEFNLLFDGVAGTGKTTTAKMIAVETNRPFVTLTGSSSNKKIIDILQNVKKKSIILIDEIHNLRENTAEIIYPAIQDKEIYFEGERIKLNKDIMFIGTTTDKSRLPKPLQDRFIILEFEEPNTENLKKILTKRNITPQAQELLLKYSHNVRRLNQIISLCKLYTNKVNKEIVLRIFKNLKIDAKTGLSKEQNQYIDYLKTHGKTSVRTLSQILRRPEGYIKNEIEPDLIRKELIKITPRGRELN